MNGILFLAGDVQHRPYPVVPERDRRIQRDGRDDRLGEGQIDLPQHAQMARAVDLRRLFERIGKGGEIVAHQDRVPGRHRAGHDDGEVAVVEHAGDDQKGRNETAAEQHGNDHVEVKEPLPPQIVAGKRIRVQHGDARRCDDSAQRKYDGIEDRAEHEVVRAENEDVRIQRKLPREQRVAVGYQHRFLRKGRNKDHPIRRQKAEGEKRHDYDIEYIKNLLTFRLDHTRLLIQRNIAGLAHDVVADQDQDQRHDRLQQPYRLGIAPALEARAEGAV